MDKGEAGAGGTVSEGGLAGRSTVVRKTKILRLGFPAPVSARGSPPSLRMTACFSAGVDLLRRRFEVEQNDLLWIHARRLHGDAGAAGDGSILDD